MRQRVFEILIDDKVVIKETTGVQFRVQFDVTIDAMGHVSYLDLLISNLKQETINKFTRDSKIGFRAGYADAIDYIFVGRVRNVFPERDIATRNTRIIARGGNKDKVAINRSLGKNVSLSKILTTIAEAMGYPIDFQIEKFDVKYTSGYAMTGDAEAYLNELSNTHNFKWVLNNDRHIICPEQDGRTSHIQTIDMFNGHEGYPEITEVGLDFNVRLNPYLQIGSLVNVESKNKTFNYSNLYFQDIPENAGTGTYKIFKINHKGDNFSNDWTTKCTGYFPVSYTHLTLPTIILPCRNRR